MWGKLPTGWPACVPSGKLPAASATGSPHHGGARSAEALAGASVTKRARTTSRIVPGRRDTSNPFGQREGARLDRRWVIQADSVLAFLLAARRPVNPRGSLL